MQKYYDKIMAIIVIGSIWGALEIFGYRLLTLLDAPHKSPYLFAIAIIVMMAAKRIVPFAGSTFIMAVIAAFYKVLSVSMPACGSNAVMALLIDSAAFEIVYWAARQKIEYNLWYRFLAAPIVTLLAYAGFAYYAQYINPEATALSPSFQGIVNYMKNSAIYAAILSLAAIHLGYNFGKALSAALSPTASKALLGFSKILGVVLAAGAWAARFI